MKLNAMVERESKEIEFFRRGGMSWGAVGGREVLLGGMVWRVWLRYGGRCGGGGVRYGGMRGVGYSVGYDVM